MNPWGTMNDWLRLEVDERARQYGQVRRPERTRRPKRMHTPALSRDDVTTCA